MKYVMAMQKPVHITRAYLLGENERLLVPMPEGNVLAEPGDWILADEKNKLSTCKDKEFFETYEIARIVDCKGGFDDYEYRNSRGSSPTLHF